MQRRKQSEAKRIENEINAKNAAEGKTEKVTVDVESVDWLYGTYKLVGEDGERVANKEEEKEGDATVDKKDNSGKGCDVTGIAVDSQEKSDNTEHGENAEINLTCIPVISKSSPKESEGIFSKASKFIELKRMSIF